MAKKQRQANIIESLQDGRLLGGLPCFRDLRTWTRWLVFLKAVYGLTMSAIEEKIFCEHTGRSCYKPPHGGFPESAAIVGRQAGKDRIGSAIQSHEAISAHVQADGTEVYSLSIAQDARSSLRTAFRYACSPFENIPLFEQFVSQKRVASWTLSNQVVLASYPCTPSSVRGIRCCCAICTEIAFFRNSENMPVDVEMLRALRPTLATTGGKMVLLSSPYGQSGALWDLRQKHYGVDNSDTLVWQGTAPEMNPILPADYLQRMERDDPEAYRSEVLGEFRAGVSTFLDPANLQACVDERVHERSREANHRYVFYTDSASGTAKDKFATAGAHYDEERKLVIVDVIRSWQPPFNPSGVIAESAELSRSYGAQEQHGDRYAPGFVAEQYRTHAVDYCYSTRDRSQLYLEFLPLVNAGQVRLLDHPECLRELRGLERRRGTTGRDRVDHAPAQHDDIANAVAGACVLAAQVGTRIPFGLVQTGYDPDSPVEVQRRVDEEWAWKREQGMFKMKEVLDRQGYHFPGDD